MYVSHSAKASKSSGAKKAKNKGSGGTGFKPVDFSNAQKPSGVTGPQSVGPLSALLAVQELDQVQTERKKAIGNARNILDQLDELKVALLSGQISPAVLTRLQQTIEDLTPPADDPHLKNLLDAVQLRARVELAKLGVGRG